jgi:hypothetical protein
MMNRRVWTKVDKALRNMSRLTVERYADKASARSLLDGESPPCRVA